ncbi:MAG: proton-conducting transporter membrane subunit [Hyphomonadaceae bacterium]
MALTLNPGFVLILAAIAVLAAPRGARALAMAGAALLALWLLLDHEFGAASAMRQMGLPVVLLNLDALNRIFGIAMLIALIVVALYSSARRSRSEDAAILLLAGGAVSALFVGDLISFVAAAALAGLAAAWIAFASPAPGASNAGARLLIWHGLEGLLFLFGAAFHLAAHQDSSVFTRIDPGSIGGAFLLAAVLIRVGAPFAHVWLKDAISHASPSGGVALSAFSTMVGVYALARMFPAEPLLVPVGAAMIVVGAFYAAAEDDMRRAGAYGLMSQTGVCVALIGIGSPLAMGAAEAHAFAITFAFMALQMTFGAIVERRGDASIARAQGLARSMPVTAWLLIAAGLAVSAVPGLALYASHAVALEAAAQWETRWLWALMSGASAVVFVSLALRPTLSVFRGGGETGATRNEAPFPMLLGAALAAFFCVSVGLAPRWLYDLMPAELSFAPFAPDRVAGRLETLGFAGLAFVLLHLAERRTAPAPVRLLDIDALYRGPLTAAGRWAGVLLLRGYGAWQVFSARLAAGSTRTLGQLAARFDRPYAARLGGALQLLSAAGVLLVMLLVR